MKNTIEQLLQTAIENLQAEQQFPDSLHYQLHVQKTKNPEHGDYASNLALVLAKQLACPPHQVAEQLIEQLIALESPHLKAVMIAGPGFINFHVNAQQKLAVMAQILDQGDAFTGLPSAMTHDGKIHIEFVSANPTGPLHVGHGRHAAYGMSVVNILRAAGYQVHAEYYVNDAGRQMDILAVSVWLRYMQQFDPDIVFADNGYRGDYVNAIAESLFAEYGDGFYHPSNHVFTDLPADEKEGGDKEVYIDHLIAKAKELLADRYTQLHQFALQSILSDIQQDLAEFGVHYDQWFAEKSLFEQQKVQQTFDRLKQAGVVYQKEGAWWFQAEKFGDEKDRVLQRENGQMTYFAPDAAYHLDKLARGFDHIIDVMGADHHGYIPRIRAVLRALNIDDACLSASLVQFAILFRGRERVQMSTRSGSFVTLRQLRQEIGNDAARFFYVMRKESQHMDFDLDLATSQSNDNPVYYIQYAHARVCSVFRQLEAKTAIRFDSQQGILQLALLTSPYESRLLDHLNHYAELIKQAAIKREPHLLANYLRELATDFHSYYNGEQFLVENENLCQARLCLIAAVRQLIANGLSLLGVSAPEHM